MESQVFKFLMPVLINRNSVKTTLPSIGHIKTNGNANNLVSLAFVDNSTMTEFKISAKINDLISLPSKNVFSKSFTYHKIKYN